MKIIWLNAVICSLHTHVTNEQTIEEKEKRTKRCGLHSSHFQLAKIAIIFSHLFLLSSCNSYLVQFVFLIPNVVFIFDCVLMFEIEIVSRTRQNFSSRNHFAWQCFKWAKTEKKEEENQIIKTNDKCTGTSLRWKIAMTSCPHNANIDSTSFFSSLLFAYRRRNNNSRSCLIFPTYFVVLIFINSFSSLRY